MKIFKKVNRELKRRMILTEAQNNECELAYREGYFQQAKLGEKAQGIKDAANLYEQ